MATTSELQQIINDPSHAISIAAGPAFADLIPQPPGSGLIVGNRVGKTPHRFVLKKAHMSREDFRIFDAVSGHIVAVLFHWGKNPYGQLDPLGLGNYVEYHNDWMGEWESLATVGGYNGMPTIKIRPKALSRHGRQFVMSWDKQTLFNIGKESKLKNMSLRSNLAVRRGDTKEVVYRILVDLLGRTFQVVNAKGELVCFVQKSAKPPSAPAPAAAAAAAAAAPSRARRAAASAAQNTAASKLSGDRVTPSSLTSSPFAISI
ncbi:hypothetical protein Rsub_00846 [Raphidocelis subcapitata]|uniref:Uncharacterized protein n=1 Tax=Raphidocelis subcapitata TaxID=307507 RepID=A0A2V0NL67_9CHLO|nr:hypothetical protein Rsub_00846 [Raphidocelis subcapitata]|eukprot:GBF88134.1 hypothetical protein Rsub_00846 [Raphidocelis subcapitata]